MTPLLAAIRIRPLAGARPDRGDHFQGFVYDLSQLDRGYRIPIFIVPGIILLDVSFG